MDKKAYLVLANGDIFEGYSFGYDCDTIGELVFTTGMGGYIETLTDESYAGQIIMQTFPLIGNYGMIENDFEGKTSALGYVVREWCEEPSNFRCGGTVDSYLKDNKIPGIYGVDTRHITKLIRENGVMNASITHTVPSDLSAIKEYKIIGAVDSVTCNKPYIVEQADSKRKVVLIDYGAKRNIAKELAKRGCSVTVVPSNTSSNEIFSLNPDGIMLSNGPGDPKENTFCIEQIKKLAGKIPMFGICLGHQLLALAMGGDTVKLKYGHRGVNQPVTEIKTGRTYITSQNHGYAVISKSIESKADISHINANDKTCEGAEYKNVNAFSVQFHPEACSGPKDTEYLFDKFIKLMDGEIDAAL